MSLRARLRTCGELIDAGGAAMPKLGGLLVQAADVLDALVALKPRLLNVYGHPDLTKSDDETFKDLLALIDQVEQ